MAIVDLDRLDLNTREGRQQALQRIREQGKWILLDAFNQANEKGLAQGEDAKAQQLETLGDLLADVDLFDKALERSKPEIITWEKIPDTTDREWLIPQWLPANTVTMFTGDGGAGKSWLTLQVCCQIACGYQDAYLDPTYTPKEPADYDDSLSEPKHIIFATYEDEPAEIKRRLYALASDVSWIKKAMGTIKRHLHIVDMRGIGSVWGPGVGKHIANTGDLLAAGEDLREICEDKEARLLVMDPLSGAFGGNENDRTAVYDFVSSFRGWGDSAKCAMLVIGHLPKGAEARAAGFSGSTAWEASARSMWKIDKKESDKKKYWALEHTKSNYAQMQTPIPLIRLEKGWWIKANDKQDAIKELEDYNRKYGIEEED